MNRPHISAILLAAGSSLRMGGRNKMLLPFQENNILQHAYNQLLASAVEEIIVVGGMGFDDLANSLIFRDSDHLLFNSNFEKGLTSSIQAGVREASRDAFMICLGDMPQLCTTDYLALMAFFKQQYAEDIKSIVLPEVNEQRGNPVIFSNHYREEILANKEPNGCKSVIQNNAGHLHIFKSDQKAYLTDVDTPEDYQRLLDGTE